MTELYDHQRKAIDFAIARKGRAGLFMEPRLGKSRAALVITERLICRRVLIVCPLSVIGVWERECRIIGYPLPVFDLTVLNGTNLRAEALRGIKDGVVLLNYESYWRQPLRDAILRWSPDALIVDEAHRLRSRTTRQSRFAHQLAQRPHVRVSLPLTGTPIANGLQDLWSVYRLIDPSLFGAWADFAGEYLTYGGYQNHCQPAGSLVKSGTKWGNSTKFKDIPIEDVKVGTEVVTYNQKNSYFVFNGHRVINTKKEWFSGDLVVVNTHETQSRFTPTHKCLSSFYGMEERHVVYIMRKDNQYRIGSSKVEASFGFGPTRRLYTEGGDALWLLGIYETEREALLNKHIISGRYGIPELIFWSGKDPELFQMVWEGIGNNEARGIKCLIDFHRDPNYPLIKKGELFRPRGQFVTEACNLMDGMCLMPFTYKRYKLNEDWTPVWVSREHYEGYVYSLEVPNGLYVADDLITHNSIVGVRNEDKAKRIVSATSFQCTRAEVFDLPQEQTIHVPVRLSAHTSTVYREMKKQALVEIEGSTSIAQTALVMLLRLHQITGGFLKEANGALIDLSYEKAETTAEIANELVSGGEQVVVFTQFLKDLDHCIERLRTDGLRVARIDGQVSGADRTKVIEEFRQKKYDVLCAQIRTASLGIDLSTASSVIFYSTGYSLDDFIQARDRIAGPNQKSKSLGYYYLQAVLDNGKGTIDSKIYEALLSKTSVAARVLELGYGGLFE